MWLWGDFRGIPRFIFVPSCSCSRSKRPFVSPPSLTENPPAVASQLERFRLDRLFELAPFFLQGIAPQFNPIENSPAFQSQRDVL
jgi:hypothetical protein